MKAKGIILCAVFIICSFTSCQTNNMNDMNNNVVLTDFTKELISMFINEPDNYYYKRANDKKYEIIIKSSTDSLNYILSIHFNDLEFYKCWRDDFVGDTLYLEQRVKVYGDKESIFYSVIDDIECQKPCEKVEYWEYNPWTWQICLNKDLSFNRTKTFKVRPYNYAPLLQQLVEKHFK